ncbi:hypothetical protein D3C76_1104990 [compost metagenome]
MTQLLQDIRVIWMLDQQSLAAFPGARQVAQRQTQAKVFAQSGRIVWLQGAPLFKKLQRQCIALALHRTIGALLQPGGINGWPLRRVEFLGENGDRLIGAAECQQAVEGLSCITTTLQRGVAALPELHVDFGGTLRPLPRQVPLGCGLQRWLALLRVAGGQLFIYLRGKPRRLQTQRQRGQTLQLQQRQLLTIDRLQARP